MEVDLEDAKTHNLKVSLIFSESKNILACFQTYALSCD